MQANLEHANITVENPDTLANTFQQLLGWEIRWSGQAKNGGYTVHVGGPNSYLALYTPSSIHPSQADFHSINFLNHLGVVVNDLDDIEQRAIKLGLRPFNHGDYEPGKRFYLLLDGQLELEIVSYSA